MLGASVLTACWFPVNVTRNLSGHLANVAKAFERQGSGGDADLMHVLWEADVAVFKAHITTGPSDKVLDLFWMYDNKKELPENHRSALIFAPCTEPDS